MEQLRTLLDLYHINWTNWVRPIEDLLLEINKGETTFTIGKDGFARHVRVAIAIIIDNKGRQLIETKQTLPNGKVRERNIPLSGKLTGEEEAHGCIIRELDEELGLKESDLFSVTARNTYTERSVSPSYTGLVSVFTYNEFDIRLCAEAYKECYERIEADGTCLTFEWKKI